MTMSDSNKSSTSSAEEDEEIAKIRHQTLKLTTAEAKKFIAEQLQGQVEVTISKALNAAMSQIYNGEIQRYRYDDNNFGEHHHPSVSQLRHDDEFLHPVRVRSQSTPTIRRRPQTNSPTEMETECIGDDEARRSCPSAKEPIALTLAIIQIGLIVLFAFMVKYDEVNVGMKMDNETHSIIRLGSPPPNMVSKYYKQYQDIQVMVFLGIGVLMSFIKKYGYSSIGFSMLAGALAVQWSILIRGLIYNGTHPIPINLVSLIYGDFAAAVVLISYGVVIGVASPLQLIFMTFAEVLFYVMNEYIGVVIFQAVDAGGSIFVHVFAAYFGLGASRALRSATDIDTSNLEGSYNSNIFCLVSVVFLWLFWPSFNSVLSSGGDQDKVVINTILSLFGSCIAAFATSSLFNGNKFILSHIQNASLAGGVAVGAVVDLMIRPFGALIVGVFGGVICTLGCQFITPILTRKLGLHDSCGVHNLHGLPGVLAALGSVAMAAIATDCEYGTNLYIRYPARAPPSNSSRLDELQRLEPGILPGVDRTGMGQAFVQLTVLCITLGISLVGGAITGLIMRLPIFHQVKGYFDDSLYFDMDDDSNDKNLPTIPETKINKVNPKYPKIITPKQFNITSITHHDDSPSPAVPRKAI